jgi:hypothetical protein
VATVRSLLRDRVTLRVRSVDRLFLHAYVPRLMSEGLLIRFLLDRGFPIPSPAVLGKIGHRYVRAIERFAARNEIPVVRFERRESKEQIAAPYFEQAEREGRFGVVMIGVAQERARVWVGWRQGGSDAHPHFAFGRQSRFPNHYYFYVRDREWGRAFVKACCYAPYPLWLCLNGHEWAKRQADQAGIEFAQLDNGFRSCADAETLAAICSSLSAAHVWAFFRRWQRLLPSPLSVDDRARGYRYQLALRQLELSDTRVFAPPAAARAWFERLLVDQLTLGRPDHVAVVFARKVIASTPGRFSTRVLRRGDQVGLQVHYKHSKVKQYLKEGCALRTETTVNDTYDFGIGRLLTQDNWAALLAIGHGVNERLLEAQLAACACLPDAATLERIVLPTTDHAGRPAPALRFGDPRVQALLASLCTFEHLLDGITNRSLRTHIASFLPGYTPRQMTYDLRRLRRNGFLTRIEHSNRYRLTAEGRRLAVFFTKTYARIITPALADLDPRLPDQIAQQSRLARAWRSFEHALDLRIANAALTA